MPTGTASDRMRSMDIASAGAGAGPAALAGEWAEETAGGDDMSGRLVDRSTCNSRLIIFDWLRPRGKLPRHDCLLRVRKGLSSWRCHGSLLRYSGGGLGWGSV